MQRVIIVHGWGGSSKNDWMPWAKRSLTEKGYEVIVPEMPETEHPKIESWTEKLSEVMGEIKEDDILIGHSIGCQAILRYIDKLPKGSKIKKIILIAPWWFLTLGDGEEQTVADPWLKEDVDFEKIKETVTNIVTVFSDNDPYVPYIKNTEFFKEKLNPEIITKNKTGHFTASEGSTVLPFLLELVK
jgi:uncharacterized protein